MQKGLDSGKGSHDRRGFAHSSASVQMEQVVHRKDMHQVLLMRFHPLRCLIQALSRFFQLYRLMYQKPLSQRRAEGVRHHDSAVRALLHDLPGSEAYIAAGTA